LEIKMRKHVAPKKEIAKWVGSHVNFNAATPEQLKPLIAQLEALKTLEKPKSYVAPEFHDGVVEIAPKILRQLNAKDYRKASQNLADLYSFMVASNSIHAIAHRKLMGYG